jgi:RimJ/RimL family protein N-acetyltransferase
MAAVALGACVIEKHFTLSNSLPGPDHAYALEPQELAQVISKIREVERVLGTGIKQVLDEELELRRFARRSIFTSRVVAKGEALGVTSASVLRAGKLAAGMHPARFMHVLGRRALHDLAEESAPLETDLEALRLVHEHVGVRPVELSDADLLLTWRWHPEVHAQLFSDEPPTVADHARWMRLLALRTDRLDFMILYDDAPVGTINLSAIDLGARTAEFGILIGEPSARGRGVAGEASILVLDLAFESLGLERVRLELFRDNNPARRLYARLGFTDEPTQPSPKHKSGQLRDVAAQSLSRTQWSKTRRNRP